MLGHHNAGGGSFAPGTPNTVRAAVELREIVKRWPGILANDRASLEVLPGEVHALLGENGAGKSTLMSILYGLYQPDSGTLLVDGKPVQLRSPADAIHAGIGMVPQHFILVPTLRVVENVALGTRSRSRWLRLNTVADDIRALVRRYRWEINPWDMVADLSLGAQQRVEIIKALYRRARVLIMDEPTSILTPQETADLMVMIRQFTADGGSVIFISHKLDEVLAISDRITVMRDGRNVGTVLAAEMRVEELARMMVGREVTRPSSLPPRRRGELVLDVQQVSARGTTQRSPQLRDVSFEVHQGEIFGIAGIDGNGQHELSAVLCGLQPVEEGAVMIYGQRVEHYLRQPMHGGVGHVPADRHRAGLVLDMSVEDNLNLRALTGNLLRVFRTVNRARARDLFARFGIKATGLDQPTRQLSGGNQQKIIFAREAGELPALLIAVQPTQGLDIGATQEVFRTLIELRQQGVAIVYISTELNELLALSDRLGVLSNGRVVGIVATAAADPETIGLMMGGSYASTG